MKSCLSCNKPCPASSIFCEECRARLLKHHQKRDQHSHSVPLVLQSEYAATSDQDPQCVAPQMLFDQRNITVQQTWNEQHQSPHLSFPLSDEHIDTDLSPLLPDSWPELEYVDSGQHASPSDSDADQADALLLRSFPTPSTGKLPDDSANNAIMKRSQPTSTLRRLPNTRVPMSPRLQRALRVIVIIALFALLMDCILMAVGAFHRGGAASQANPLLTVTPGVAHPGQTVSLHLSHFTPLTQVFLTHDIQIMVITDTASSLVQVDASGNAIVQIRIGAWGSGQHSIQGEDVKTHYTAIATIQIVGDGKILPSHLVLSQNTMDMGSDLQNANTIHPLVLRNTGNGSLSWRATSDRPWLLITPTQGIFSDNESIFVAVTRAHLNSGVDYHGTITFMSSNGNQSILQVKMQVLPLPVHAIGVLVATPPALSFVAIDSGSNPVSQQLKMGNAGSQLLSWYHSKNILQGEMGQQMLLNGNTQWSAVLPSSGRLVANSWSPVQVGVNTRSLLPGVYSMILVFASTKGVLNNPEQVALSLTILPHSIYKTNQASLSLPPNPSKASGATKVGATSTTIPATATSQPGLPVMNISTLSLSFSGTEGDPAPASQILTLTNSGGTPFYWQATIPSSASSWLNLSPLQGAVYPTQSVQIAVSITIEKLTPGFYTAQLPISAVNGSNVPLSNSPQLITIGMTLYAACAIHVNPTSLAFSASTLDPKPAPQSITLRESGNCSEPVSWSAAVDQKWITVSNSSGQDNATIIVSVDASQLLPGNYTASISFSATDNGGSPVQVSPQTLQVTLAVSI
jgi:hypothetical protein